MFIFVFSRIFILDNPLGISTNISLNSFINGGNTRKRIVKIINEIIDITNKREINLGSFNLLCNWSHKLHTIFDITKEHIIKRKKSLNTHKNKMVINITVNLK